MIDDKVKSEIETLNRFFRFKTKDLRHKGAQPQLHDLQVDYAWLIQEYTFNPEFYNKNKVNWFIKNINCLEN